MVGCEGNGSGGGTGGTTDGTQTTPIDVDNTRAAGVGIFGGKGDTNDGDIKNVWNHGCRISLGFKCGFCGHHFKSGGATRLREHLGGIIGNVQQCMSVSSEVRSAMRNSHSFGIRKRKESKEFRKRLESDLIEELGGHRMDGLVPSDEEEQIRMAIQRSKKEFEFHQGRGFPYEQGASSGHGSTIGSNNHSRRYGSGRGSHSVESEEPLCGRGPIQPRIDTVFAKGTMEKLRQAWSIWFHANDIPGLKANCPYFKAAMRLTQQLGVTSTLFNANDIDNIGLEENYKDMENTVDRFKKDWAIYGVTLMCDSWTGPTAMSIINFMVYCNGRVFFHKAIDATNETQNADFLSREIEEVINEIGHEAIVQIVTDNGSNYKKACRLVVAKYNHIVWQPCAAHTVNLMMKDIAKFSEVDDVVASARTIAKFFYNHNRLHSEMKKKIDGELIRPNATRFGTVYMFLNSMWEKKDKFRQWVVSPEWKELEWRNDNDYCLVEDWLSSPYWWDSVKGVLDTIGPLYTVLRYADEDNGTLSGFMPKMVVALKEMESYLGEGSVVCTRYMKKITKRVSYLYKDTLVIAAAVLDPVGHYHLHLSDNHDYVNLFQEAIERIQDSIDSGLQALAEFEAFRSYTGKFGGVMARRGVGRMSATVWWTMFGGETRELQRYAIRIVSQCISSSGCERNWSAFALIHTRLRGRLGYEKLKKLVFVHYNLKLRIKQEKMIKDQGDVDPYSLTLDAGLFNKSDTIMGLLDSEEDHETTLEQLCARIRKRKNTSIRSRANKGKMPMRDEDILESENDMDSESENDMDSPTYVESGDSSSNDDENLATFDNETTAQEKDIQVKQGGSHLRQGRKKRKCNTRTKNVNILMHQT